MIYNLLNVLLSLRKTLNNTTMLEIVSIFVILLCILQMVLFYKVWKMTDHVKELNLTLKAKEARELGLPRKAKLKSRDINVDAYDVENGQILCQVEEGGVVYSEAYNYDEVELL